MILMKVENHLEDEGWKGERKEIPVELVIYSRAAGEPCQRVHSRWCCCSVTWGVPKKWELVFPLQYHRHHKKSFRCQYEFVAFFFQIQILIETPFLLFFFAWWDKHRDPAYGHKWSQAVLTWPRIKRTLACKLSECHNRSAEESLHIEYLKTTHPVRHNRVLQIW